MEHINIHAAKTQPSALVERTAAGDPFIISKAGCPLVTVSPYNVPEPLPRIGFMKGQISVPEDFDRMSAEEIIAMFEDSSEKAGDSI